MKTKPSKNHGKIGDSPKGSPACVIEERLATYRGTLRHSTSLSKEAAGLARELLATTEQRVRQQKLGTTVDLILGATTASALTALACGDEDRAEFCAWLRRTADSLDVGSSTRNIVKPRSRAPAPSPNQP
jgi:hypothetical protein